MSDLSLTVAKEIANSFRVDFGKGIDVTKDSGAWRDSLADAGLDDDTALQGYLAFKRAWSGRRLPNLNDLANYVRQSIRIVHGAPVRPRSERCGLCDDSGLIPCAVPERRTGEGLAPLSGFVAGETWTDTAVYAVSLSCKCDRGGRWAKKGLSDRWQTLRDDWWGYYTANPEHSPAYWQARFLRGCHEAYREKQAKESQHAKEENGQAARDSGQDGAGAAESPRFPGKGDEPVNEAPGTAGAVEEVDPALAEAEDVPEGEIPF